MTTREDRMARIMARPRIERVAPTLPAEPEEIAQPTPLAPEPERENAQPLSVCPASGPDGPVSDSESHPALLALHELRAFQASIPARRRDLVAELNRDGISFAEIAREMGVSRQSVREWAGEKSH